MYSCTSYIALGFPTVRFTGEGPLHLSISRQIIARSAVRTAVSGPIDLIPCNRWVRCAMPPICRQLAMSWPLSTLPPRSTHCGPERPHVAVVRSSKTHVPPAAIPRSCTRSSPCHRGVAPGQLRIGRALTRLMATATPRGTAYQQSILQPSLDSDLALTPLSESNICLVMPARHAVVRARRRS